MAGWDTDAVILHLEALRGSQAALRRLPAGDPSLDAARQEVQTNYGRLLLAYLGGASPVGQEGGLSPLEAGALQAMQVAIRLEWVKQRFADHYPEAEWPQDWPSWLAYGLYRLARFCLATSLVDLVTFMGAPPYLGWLRGVLILAHWALSALIWLLASGTHKLARLLAGLLVVAVASGVGSFYAWAFSNKDLPARDEGVRAMGVGLEAFYALLEVQGITFNRRDAGGAAP